MVPLSSIYSMLRYERGMPVLHKPLRAEQREKTVRFGPNTVFVPVLIYGAVESAAQQPKISKFVIHP